MNHKYSDLINRLRGIYTIPVNDGGGLLNGKSEYTRVFTGLPAINEEAAKAIEDLMEQLRENSLSKRTNHGN